jgi:hypothetical protein
LTICGQLSAESKKLQDGEKMHELYLEKPGDLKMRESAPAPAPKDNEVKVKVIYGGIAALTLGFLEELFPMRPILAVPVMRFWGRL